MSENLIALQNKFLGHGSTVYDALSRIRAERGCISDSDLESLAREHNLPLAHLRATAKFYDELSEDSAAAHSVRVCNGEACRAAGSDALTVSLQEALAADSDRVRLTHVTCLGYCGVGPALSIDDRPLSLQHESALEGVVAHLTRAEPLELTEPENRVYPPASGTPTVLLRHHGHDVVGLEQARSRGAYSSLESALISMTPEQVLSEVEASGLRGRGGAGFPTGIKLRTVASSEAPDGSGRKFVVVNFDEGDAGSYIDKELVERDPHTQLEGVLLAAYATGSQKAYIYVRSEYPKARAVLAEALAEAREAGLVGAKLNGSDFSCEVEIVRGQGAYICGEETSLLRSIEGVPALVSIRPPFPAQEGLWRCPTAVNNVETIHNLPWIIANGGAAYAAIGHGKSRGTKLVSLNTKVARPGVYEVPFGTTLRQIIFELAGGMAPGLSFKGVQIGGPLGGILPESALDTPLDFEAVAEAGGIVGHAGMVVYDSSDDLVKIARGLMHFCAVESCGKCFPCRIGSVRGTELFDQMLASGVTPRRLELLDELCETMELGSLCAMGSMTPAPIRSLLEHFPEDLDRYRHAEEKS